MARVAIVGAGISGLALAKYLSRRCHDHAIADMLTICIFERRPAPDGPDGGALLIQGEGVDVLKDFGFTNLLDDNLTGAGELLVMRDAMISFMLEGLGERVDLRLNTQVSHVLESETGVELHHRPLFVFRDGGWVENENLEVSMETFDLVVGADGNGPASCVAKGMLGREKAQAKPIDLLILQALTPCASNQDDAIEKDAYLREGVHGIVGKLSTGLAVGLVSSADSSSLRSWQVCTVMKMLADPMRNFPARMSWAEVMKESALLCKDDALQKEAISIIERATAIKGVGRLHAWVPFRKDVLECWWSPGGRLVALGDAAHLMAPTKGWGANCALGDARKLSEVLLFLLESGLLGAGAQPEQWHELGAEQFEAERRRLVAPLVSASLAEARKIAGRV